MRYIEEFFILIKLKITILESNLVSVKRRSGRETLYSYNHEKHKVEIHKIQDPTRKNKLSKEQKQKQFQSIKESLEYYFSDDYVDNDVEE